MILAYERLQRHSELDWGYWNYNGRYEPSMLALAPDQIERELSERHAAIYRMISDPHGFPLAHSTQYAWSNILFHDTPYNNQVQRLEVADVQDQPYIYPIVIKNMGIFTRYNSHISVSPRVRQHALRGQARIVFVYHLEGNVRYHQARFDSLVKQMDLPPSSIYLLHGDHDTEFFAHSPYQYLPTNCFPWRIYQQWPSQPVDYQPDRLFVCYNRQPRPHRLLLLNELAQAGLLTQALVSCGELDHVDIRAGIQEAFGIEWSDAQIQALRNLSGSSPDSLRLDPATLSSYNPANQVSLDHYTRTFVSLVTETLVDGLFFSEKIYKPIMMGHPFLLLAGAGQLAQLRQWGFQTFSQWWDESYDQEPDCATRIRQITHILTRLSQLTPAQLQAIRQDMQPVLDHNRRVFRSLTWDCDPAQRDNLFNAFRRMYPDY